MRTDLNFEDESVKKLLSKLDFEFFLNQNIEVENYNKHDIELIYVNYKSTKQDLKLKRKNKKRQYNYFLEGKVRKMFNGGFLPSHFELDKSIGHRFLDFSTIGEDWAYFELWQSYYKSKIFKENFWEYTIKTGSILAIILTILKLLENFKIL